jgi:hypothetical protein
VVGGLAVVAGGATYLERLDNRVIQLENAPQDKGTQLCSPIVERIAVEAGAAIDQLLRTYRKKRKS